MCENAKIEPKTINGIDRIMIPEKTNMNDGIIDKNKALTRPVFFLKTTNNTM